MFWKYITNLFKGNKQVKDDPTKTEGLTFEQWFKNQKFRNFKVTEFTDYFNVKRRGVRNSYPPRELWNNIVPVVRILDDLRDELDTSITITSSYRSPSYNAAISGAASKSYHMQFLAADIQVSGFSPREVYKLLLSKRDKGLFKGGLSSYPTFVHIDTRGKNANW